MPLFFLFFCLQNQSPFDNDTLQWYNRFDEVTQ